MFCPALSQSVDKNSIRKHLLSPGRVVATVDVGRRPYSTLVEHFENGGDAGCAPDIGSLRKLLHCGEDRLRLVDEVVERVIVDVHNLRRGGERS